MDTIYSSDKTRAHETAKAIASASKPPKEVIQREWLTEKDHGPEFHRHDMLGNNDAAYYARTGISYSPYSRRNIAGQIRFFVPKGSESEYDTGHRAQAEILSLLLKHGVLLTEEDKVKEWDDVVEVAPSSGWKADMGVSSKISHIMIISHSLFLTELYESLGCWNSFRHDQTGTKYDNAEWWVSLNILYTAC